MFETCSRKPFDPGSNFKVSLSYHLEPRFLMQFINFLVVLLTLNVSLTVGYRDTSRGDGLTIRDDDEEYHDEECEKVLKEVAAYLQANIVALPSPGKMGCRKSLNFFVVEAARFGDMETLNWLLRHDMNPNAMVEGQSAVLAALQSDKLEVVMCLLDHGAYPQTEDPKTGDTLLHYAALQGHYEIVKTLIGRGVDVDAKNSEGFTPLHEAARTGQADVVNLLLGYGEADINGKAGPGEKTPFEVATPEVKDLLKPKP